MPESIKQRLLNVFENIFKNEGFRRYKLKAKVKVLEYQMDWDNLKDKAMELIK